MTTPKKSGRGRSAADKSNAEREGARPHPPPSSKKQAREDVRQAAGNFAIQRVLRKGAIQAKLEVGEPGDPYEREADRVADSVVSSTDAGTVQRKCLACAEGATCPKCQQEERLRAKERPGQTPRVNKGAEAQLSGLRGGGSPLPASVRDFAEPRFGQDFGGVRVHTGGEAARAARSMGARAFTSGRDVVFAEGEYAPESTEGRRLLAHELAHVVQQGAASDPSGTRWSHEEDGVQRSPRDPAEAERDTDEAELEGTRAEPTLSRAPSREQLQKDEDEALARDVAAFKQLVLTVARARLASNRVNLSKWRALVENIKVDDPQQRLALQVAQLQNTAQRQGPVEDYVLNQGLAESNPIRRELKLGQVEGRYRACTGCHMEMWATQLENETPEWQRTGKEWVPLADRLTGIDSRDRGYVSSWLMNYPMPDLLTGGAGRPAASDEELIAAWLNESASAAPAAQSHATASHAPPTAPPTGAQVPNADQMAPSIIVSPSTM